MNYITRTPPGTTIYRAGKISHTDWRHQNDHQGG
jgi:hypothetical protein